MRQIPAQLQTHIQQEVTSLARCYRITRTDGMILRLTQHDVPLTINGDVYAAGLPIEMSAIESTGDLTVDNAELTVGIDGTLFSQADLEVGLFDNAAVEVFLVNWEDTSDGVINLKRGTFGDIEIADGTSVKFQLRGLTHLLQRPVVEKYSLTCRVAFGSARCGYANMPTQVRRNNQKVKTFDWFVVPTANITVPSLTNMDFESALSTGWTIPGASSWVRDNDFTPFGGSNYAEGSTGSTGQEHVMYRDITTATLGMADADVDDGDFSFDFSAQIAATSALFRNTGKLFIEQYNALGQTLKRDETAVIQPDFQSWQGIGVTAFVLPGTRTIRIGMVNRIDSGSAGYVAFDGLTARYWTNEMSTFGSKTFRTMKLPVFAADELVALTNNTFDAQAAQGNSNTAGSITGWTKSGYWQTVSSSGGLSGISSLFLLGGNNGSGTPAQVYSISQTRPLPTGARADDVTNGWYWSGVQLNVAKTDSDSAPRVTVEFLNASGTVLSTIDSGYMTGLTEDTWDLRTVGGRVPSSATQARVTLYARSGAGGSAANAAFDNVRLAYFPTAYEHDLDPELAYLADTQPTYDYDANDYTSDGDAIVQARSPVFNFGAVTGVTSTRIFNASAVSDTAELLYSGKIVWLSGANAGRTSYIRIWDNTAKVVKLYDDLREEIQIGDKFVYARGCDKTIARCSDTFGNAHNFRGEPYLPGPSKVISFLAATQE